MLVLTRKRNESIRIGDDIVITIGDIRGDAVKMAISAPKDIKIFRSEVYDSIAKENQTASMNENINPITLLDDLRMKKSKE